MIDEILVFFFLVPLIFMLTGMNDNLLIISTFVTVHDVTLETVVFQLHNSI